MAPRVIKGIRSERQRTTNRGRRASRFRGFGTSLQHDAIGERLAGHCGSRHVDVGVCRGAKQCQKVTALPTSSWMTPAGAMRDAGLSTTPSQLHGRNRHFYIEDES